MRKKFVPPVMPLRIAYRGFDPRSLPWTPRDIERAVVAMLSDEEFSQMSDIEIGIHIGTPPHFVREIRAEIELKKKESKHD